MSTYRTLYSFRIEHEYFVGGICRALQCAVLPVGQSLMTLLSTSPGERVHRYDYGCPLREYAFEKMDASTKTMLRDRIERSIIMFEPRVVVNAIEFDENATDGVLNIRIDYTIKQTNSRTNMVYPFYFVEGTDLTNI